MKTNSPEVAQNELTNFEKIDMDILMKQNLSLVNEINKLKHDWLQNEDSQQENMKFYASKFNKSLVDLAGQLKTYFHDKSFGIQADPFVKDLSLFLRNFFDLVEDICIKRSCLDQAGIKKWFELNKLPLEIFYSKLKQITQNTQSNSQSFDYLDQKIADFQSNFLLPSQIPTDNFKNQIRQLNVQIEDLTWENSILQKRINFVTEYTKIPLNSIIDIHKNQEKYYCYCGGQVFKAVIDQLHIEDMIKNFQTQFSKQNQQTEPQVQKNLDSKDKQKYEQQITILKQELQNIIELLEQKKLSKNTLSELVLSSNFFQKIQNDFKIQQEYILELSSKYENLLKQSLDLEQLRKKELLFYRKQEDQQKQKLKDQLKNAQVEKNKLNQKIVYQQQQIEQLEKIKVRKQINNNNEQIVQSLNSQIKNLSEKYFEKTEKQNNYLQKKLEQTQKNLFSIEKEKFLDQRIQNREFRHKEHKKFTEEVKKIASNNKEILQMTENIEKYLKTREKKIRTLEKSLEDYKKFLKEEKANNKCLIEEIVNGCKAFECQQNKCQELSQELESITNNFNDVFNEKSLQQKQLKEKIEQLEKHIAKNLDDNRLLQQENANLQFLQQQKDKEIQNNKFQISDLDNSLKSQRDQYQAMSQENQNLLQKLELYQSKLETVKQSNKTLSKELSNNVTKITEKEAIIKTLLQNDLKTELSSNPNDLTLHEKHLYLMNQIELKRLQKILKCKASSEADNVQFA